MSCPTLLPALVIADNAQLAAQISCIRATPGAYLPVIDGPRLGRPDRDQEVYRRISALRKVRPEIIVLAGLSDESATALMLRLGRSLTSKVERVATSDDLAGLPRKGRSLSGPTLRWGRDRIGVGLLKALRSGAAIEFSDEPSPTENMAPRSDHLVVCEEGNDLSQVIAANYAFALRAGLCLIPVIEDEAAEAILERLYSLYEQRQISPTEALEQINTQLRDLCGNLPIPDRGSLTFITGRLPYGFAYPEVPSTHLLKYPDLGISIINGLAAEQPKTRGIGVAVLVDPGTTDAPEIEAAEQLLPPRGIFLRVYQGPAANVRDISEMLELFPYDLLLISTHCGDAPGYRWTYEFTDSKGLARTLVVDIAIGVARTEQEDMLNVTQFIRFISLDGVDWTDPEKSDKLYVGTAINDFMARTRRGSDNELQPVKKETVERVVGSAVLRMYDQNYISLPRGIADEGTPIIINNACCSWHRLAHTYAYCNARAYVGTLFPVTTSEAHQFVVKLLGKHFGKPLPAALWSAQREVYGGGVRRPYVMTGVYPQRLRTFRHDRRQYIASRLSEALAAWQRNLRNTSPSDEKKVKMIRDTVRFYERQIEAFRERWLTPTARVADKR